jgi:spore coat protein A
MLTRRDLLQRGLAAGAMLTLAERAFPFAQSPTTIPKFTIGLPGVGPAAGNELGNYIPLATKQTRRFAGLTTDTYSVAVRQYRQLLHPAMSGATTFRGYVDATTNDARYLAGAIVATRDTPILLTVQNGLGGFESAAGNILPIDPGLMASETSSVGDLPQNRIATHLHGGLTPWFSDGTPFQWYAPDGSRGTSFMNVPGTAPPAGTATYYYPNQQSARTVWYHDHAMGLTRTNAYSGIAAPFIITDPFEQSLLAAGLLPDLVGVPLVLQDKGFVADDILAQDPGWKWGGPGSLWYPHDYEPDRWEAGPGFENLDRSQPSCVPEAFFDTVVVNGAPYPVVTVTDQTVRLRLLNGSQARFWHLNLQAEAGATGEADLSRTGPTLFQVGTEGGFLPDVVALPNGRPCPLLAPDTANPDAPFNLLLAPAERADVLVDFTGQAGRTFILYNDAPAPFPGGGPENDYYTGKTALPGFGRNTRTLLRVRVVSGTRSNPLTPQKLALLRRALAANFNEGFGDVPPQQDRLLAPWNPVLQQFVVPRGVRIYNKTLNEDFDAFGRLQQRAGTDAPVAPGVYGRDYVAAPTEVASNGEVQVWDVYNLTGDTHPWHFHLANVQIVGRGIYAVGADGVTPVFGQFSDLAGAARRLTPPAANERGWKDTVRMNPGQVTRVIMRLSLPRLPRGMPAPTSPRFPGYAEYVHHCHILEHEEHDMMRPLLVRP